MTPPKPSVAEQVTAAALLARIDERTTHLVKITEDMASDFKETRRDLNGLGSRVTTIEGTVDNHKWLLRTLAGLVTTIIAGLVIWYLTAR